MAWPLNGGRWTLGRHADSDILAPQVDSAERGLDPQSSDDEGDDNEETHDAVGIGDAMSKILGQNLAEDAQTILAKRSTARMGEIQSDKKEIKAA
ncbi:hypothetical protein PF005_g19131 [Phytophthora fragariae]|uniref:Uncharacterized protein n=2 Tax=Phytophthora fragariae TaxID=53985 RepID=A0A6A4CSA6_9STRA|nr:hypothetical protein PF005_g19131 [Phytophthora fragariae]KAE9293337.1 hypothetical protein PF001_g18306 [Phytophthora fragariae]